MLKATEYMEYNNYSLHYLAGGNTPALYSPEPNDCGSTEPEEPEADANVIQRRRN